MARNVLSTRLHAPADRRAEAERIACEGLPDRALRLGLDRELAAASGNVLSDAAKLAEAQAMGLHLAPEVLRLMIPRRQTLRDLLSRLGPPALLAALALPGCTASWTVAPLPKPLHVHTAACRPGAIVSTPRQAEPIVARDAGGVPTQIFPAVPPPLDQAPWPEAAPPQAEDTPPGLPELTPAGPPPAAVPLRLPKIEAAPIEAAPKVKARGLAMREGGAS